MSQITIEQSAFLASNLESSPIWCEVMYIFAFTYVKCSFQLKYLAIFTGVRTGISDYVMEELFCSALGYRNKRLRVRPTFGFVTLRSPRNSLSTLIFIHMY